MEPGLLFLHLGAEFFENLARYLVLDHREHLVFLLVDVVLGVLHQDLKLRLEPLGVTRKLIEFRQEQLHLAMLFDALADDLLKVLVAMLQKVRVKDRLFYMGVSVQLELNILVGFRVVRVLVFLHLLEVTVDDAVIRRKDVDGVRFRR